MDDAITVSSGSEKYDSDVEFVGSYTVGKVDSKPFVREDTAVDIVAVNVTPLFIDLTDPRWALPGRRRRKRLNSNAQMEVVDLIDSNITDGKEQKTKTLSADTKNGNEDTNLTSNSRGSDSLHNSSRDLTISPVQDCFIPKQGMFLASVTESPHQRNTNKANYFPCFVNTPFVKLRRLHLAEAHVKDLKTSGYSAYVTKDCKQLSLWPKQSDNICGTRECIKARTATTSNGPRLNHSADESPEVVETPWELGQIENKKEQRPSRKEETKQLELNLPESRQSPVSNHSSPHFPTTELDPHIPHYFDLNCQPHTSSASPCHSLKSQAEPTITSKDALAGTTPVWQTEGAKADLAMNSPVYLCHSDPPLSVPRTEDLDEGSMMGRITYTDDLGVDSPVHVDWQEGSDEEEANEENKFDGNFRGTSREDRRFVCPVTLRKIMSRPAQSINAEEKDDDGFSTAEVLCRQSLSLVYSTIEESYPEGTLQLLSDLLQPGFYPPRDIISHLLRDILLDLQCPQHLCVQAFNLLMRTQRHHMADKTTLSWDWELLTSVMANQDNAKRHRCEVVRMFLEYVVQTLEDDFQTKLSLSALHRSIAKATLSCDLQFTKVRDVIKWLFAAIRKSTENGDNREAAKERDEHIRMVSVFQRMLSVALEVDRSPAVSSAKLSLELFHMLMNIVTLRAHRMLLLESLQSKLLRCKLLEHLLDYACPQKTPLPMSLSLLLHFLKNCTLTPDSMDGTERWQRWEELVQLLWMLLLSYNKGHLCSSVTEGTGSVRALVHKPHDVVSRPAVREAVESFLSRSQADLGQALPLHVDESLTYLQDHLLDVCQC